ncbi:MucB/RseB C-terminal domain-containing protein [Thiolapillus sp.]
MRSGLLALLFCLCSTGLASDANSSAAVQWLEKMNLAVISMNYEGHFVCQCGDSLEAMHLRHQIGEDGPRESLSSLTGVPREVLRDSKSITIITNRNGKLHISQQPAAGKLSPLKSLQPEKLLENYRISLGGIARIAGRPGVVINLMPNDNLRYGYRLTLDKMSALPLDLMVMDRDGALQSRIMFTDLKITDVDLLSLHHPDEEDNAAAKSLMLAKLGAAGVEDAPAVQSVPLQTEPATPAWNFPSLPSGFSLIDYQKSPRAGLEHFVFSDGLATVSVYLEPLDNGKVFEGFANLGSVRVLGRRLKDYQLTVVGEVPQKTLELLASSVHSNAGAENTLAKP